MAKPCDVNVRTLSNHRKMIFSASGLQQDSALRNFRRAVADVKLENQAL